MKAISKHSSDNSFISDTGEDPFGYRNEKMLRTFKEDSFNLQEFLSTSQVIRLVSDIVPDQWNNIPPCLVKSMKHITEALIILEKKTDGLNKTLQ
jgi:hypothetical protein